MATSAPIHPSDQLTDAVLGGSVALVPAEAHSTETSIASDPAIAAIPIELDVAVPVRNFRVRNLLALSPGQIIESRSGHSEDLPLAAGGVRLASCEFEVVDTQLAVRLTRLD